MNVASFLPEFFRQCTAVLGLSLLFFFSPVTLDAQGWLRYYPSVDSAGVPIGSEPDQLIVADNGDFIFAGTGFITDSATSGFYLQRNDADGNLLWLKDVTIPGFTVGTLYFLEKCPGGGYVCGGAAKVNGAYSEIMFRVTESGDLLWVFQPAIGIYGSFYTVAPTPEGKLLVGGMRGTGPTIGDLTSVLYKIDPADGSVIWLKSYGDSLISEVGTSVLLAPDGSILFACISGNNILVRQMDADGNQFRKTTIAGQINDYPILRRPLSDGYTLLRYWNQAVYFYRYDYSGNLLATKKTDNLSLSLRGSTENSQGLAFTLSPVPPSGPRMPVLYKMDFDGNFAPPIRPLENFSLSLDHIATNVKATPDGGFLLIGANQGQATWFALKTDSTGYVAHGAITGNIFHDIDADCAESAGEPPLHPVQLRATDLDLGMEWYETTDTSGRFNFGVPTGDYEIEVLPPGGAAGYWQPCPPLTASLTLPGDSVAVPPLGLQALADCPFLQLDLGATLFRPCSTTVVTATVLNAGTAPADSSTVLIEYDPLLTFDSSSIPPIAQNGNFLWFDAGALASLQSTSFQIFFTVDCAAQLGQTICLDGHVSPDSLCTPANPLWDGAELKIDVLCDGDSVRFQITNVGAGGMDAPSQLVIIEDYIILFTAPLQLPAGQDTVISLLNANGQTYYARIRQTEGFPGFPFATDGKDFCSGAGTAGMLLQYPLFSGGPFDTRYCEDVRTSYDPNDKRGFPLGYGPSHYIDRGQPLRYLIRFQNTGNDTAFQVTVRDTLPAQLDPASLRIGGASHPFKWSLSGQGVLTFRFANILLPDSTTNEPASHGYVQFSIQPRADLPPATVVQNRAAIYFDYNAPVFTEYAWHTVDSNFIPLHTLDPGRLVPRLSLWPNPASDATTLTLGAALPGAAYPLALTLFDVFGKTLRQELVFGQKHVLRREGLPAGVCFLKLEDRRGAALGAGKMVWER